MHSSRLPLFLISLLLLGSGTLVLMLGNIYPLIVSIGALLAAGLLSRHPTGRTSAWLSTLGAVLIFLSGTPITGAPPEGLLVTAVMSIYFICWVQQHKLFPESTFAPTGPLTLAFYASLLLCFLLLRSRLFPMPYALCVLVATLIVLTSLALWELGRRSRLTQAAQVQTPTLPDWVGRFLVLLAIALSTFLLFRLPLPLMAEATLSLAHDLNLTADPPSASKERRPSSWQKGENSADRPEGENGERSREPGQGRPGDGTSPTDPWTRGVLPKQADLELSNTPRFHLEFPEGDEERVRGRPLYLRAQALGLYRDGMWSRKDEPGRWVTDAEDGKTDHWVTFAPVRPEQAIRQRIYLYNHLQGGALVGMPNVVAFRGKQVFRQGDDFLAVEGGGDITYDVVSAPIGYEDVIQSRELEAGEAPDVYLEKAQGLTFRDIDNLLLAPILEPDRTLKQKLTFVRRLFQENYRYSERVENPANQDPLSNFLFHEKQGYCDFFAQAGAHMVRRLGVPSRVAYGYAGGLYDPVNALYTFRERDAHAWTEIFLQDHGWVVFDLVPSGQGPHRLPQTQPGKAPTSDPLRQFRPAEEPAEALNPEGPRRPPVPRTDWEAWFDDLWALRYLDIALVATVSLLLIVYGVRRWRQRRLNPDDKDPAALARTPREPPGYFRDFCELFAQLGQQRAPGQTLREYFRQLQEHRFFQNEFDALLDYHYRVEYESADRSRQTEKQFSKEIREFRSRYRSGHSGPLGA